jgi:hypothetical protein
LFSYARVHNFTIAANEVRNYIQFADGSSQETMGRVETFWRFDSGKRIPITFEVLKRCAAAVIIGEDILFDHCVFEEHGSSLILFPSTSTSYDLAPFGFKKRYQATAEKLAHRIESKCQVITKPTDSCVEGKKLFIRSFTSSPLSNLGKWFMR